MIEVYLFVNPLSQYCLSSEQQFLSLIQQTSEKVHLRLIPVLSPTIIQHYLEDQFLPLNDLDYRNQLTETIYSACLDVKAAQLQGKAAARDILFALQYHVGQKGVPYSKDLVNAIINRLNIDTTQFYNDRYSPLIRDFFRGDQQIANEMGVSYFSKAVIFNYKNDTNMGVLIDSFTPSYLIKELLDARTDWTQPPTHKKHKH